MLILTEIIYPSPSRDECNTLINYAQNLQDSLHTVSEIWEKVSNNPDEAFWEITDQINSMRDKSAELLDLLKSILTSAKIEKIYKETDSDTTIY